jgi:DNA polymerase-3 subunit alpha
MQDLTPLNGREVGIAGVVTSVTPMSTKDGRKYARFVMEDYNSQHEFTLFSKDYEKFGMLIEQNNFLYIKGRIQPRPYREPEELEFKISNIQHLADVVDSISAIKIELGIHEVCNTLTDMFVEKATNNKGKASLSFTIVDHNDDVRIRLSSKSFRVAPTTEFMDFLDNNDLNYIININ